MLTPPWLLPPDSISLEPESVHVWRLDLFTLRHKISELSMLLSADERDRVDRFGSEKVKQRTILVRGALRRILSQYLSIAPSEIGLAYTPHGKPILLSQQGMARFDFNVSHSGELALIAISSAGEVGVDVEMCRERSLPDVLRIASRFFSEYEFSGLRYLDPDSQLRGFYRCWTCKEAFIKAKGLGMSLPLSSFDVSFDPDRPAGIVKIRSGDEESTDWYLGDLFPGDGYAAAYVVRSREHDLSCWNWEHP